MVALFAGSLALLLSVSLGRAQDVASVRITYDLLMSGPPSGRKLIVRLANEMHGHSPDVEGVYWKRYLNAYAGSLTPGQSTVLKAHITALQGTGQLFGLGRRGVLGPDGAEAVLFQEIAATEPSPTLQAKLKELRADADREFGARLATQLFTLSGIASAPYLSESAANVLADLGSKDPETRGRAAYRAGKQKLGEAPVIAALATIVTKDDVYPVREVAAWSLAAIGGPDALKALTNALESDKSNRAIPAALAAFPDRRALPLLLKALGSTDPHVAGNAAHALGVLGDSRARAPLNRLLNNETIFTQVDFGEPGVAGPAIRLSGLRVSDAARTAQAQLGAAKAP